MAGRLHGALLHPALRHPLRRGPLGRVPGDAAVHRRVVDGDEVLDTRGAAGRGAQVRRAQDLRR